ncbi:MAG: TIGR02281 family clan AA aspartic protease [Mariprofundaceae bacterium]
MRKLPALLLPLLFLPLLFLPNGTAHAEIYKWVDASGHVHFTDKPVHGSKQLNSRPISTISNPEFNLEKTRMQMRFTERNGSMLVQGKVNGIAMQFVVDTGASYVGIPPGIAKRARINTEGVQKITLQTANGKIEAPLITASTIEAGGIKQRNILTTVQELSPDGNTGLLGMSFLANYRMTIDRERKLILLEKK